MVPVVGNVSQIANVEGGRLIKKKQRKIIENVNFSIALSLSKQTNTDNVEDSQRIQNLDLLRMVDW